MKIPLSPRLQTCCNFIAPGDRVADVGTDHGYLGIWLLQKGLASHVIASDIGEGPLSAAKANAQRFGFTQRMTFCLSDGVQNIPRDFDTLVIAGMGAQTMIHILQQAPWLQSTAYRLVLQPQNKPQLLRAYLSQQGWRITEESLVRDGRFLYAVMEVVWQPDYPPLTGGEYWFSPALLENPSPDLPEYYNRIVGGLRKAALNRQDPQLLAALEELEALANTKELSFLKEANHDHCK